MTTMELSPAVVIGTGLVGASVALALSAAGVHVHLRDAVGSHAAVAASLGAGTTETVAAGDVRLVVVAVPPSALADVIEAALAEFPTATITDVGSVKGTVLAALRQRGVGLGRYVGSHPMAGSQHAGPLTARADLFVDRTWVITPHDTASAHAVLAVQDVARLCGARVATLGAAHHDEAVAQVSHLPQLVSTLVGRTLTDVPGDHLRLAGQGLRDVTRIAGSDPALWRQIITANRAAVRVALHRVDAALDELLAILDLPEGEGEAALEAFLAAGRDGVRRLPGKHGTVAAQAFAQVVVRIPDAPGALARLFADIEAAGVNVEDVSIEHDTEQEVGYLAVQVSPTAAQALGEAMTRAGWALRA